MIDKIKETIQNINKFHIFAAVFGVSAVGAFVYFIRKNKKNKDKEDSENGSICASETKPELVDISPEVVKMPDSEEKALVRVLNKLKRFLTDRQGIGYEGVKEIYKSPYELSKNQFKAATLKNRRERRLVINNLVEYNRIFSQYSTSIQTIHNSHLNAVLAYFKIDKGVWINLTQQASSQNIEDWQDFIISTDQEQLDSLRNQDKPKLKLPILVQIEKFRIIKLRDNLKLFKQTFAELDASDLYNVAQKWAVDNVYEKFKVEQQDINYSLKQLTSQEKEVIQQQEDQLKFLMKSLIIAQSASEEQNPDQEQN